MNRIYQNSKYHSKKCVVDGMNFDSRKEADRYFELKILEKSGLIRDLHRQCKFELIPAQYESFERYGKKGNRLKDGSRCIEKPVTYIADFVYFDNQKGKTIVEDTKGFKTTEYIIKRKLMLYIHKIKIQEV